MPDVAPQLLKLTDFMDLATLQEIQDSFAAVAQVRATITDAEGKVITSQTPSAEFLHRQGAIAAAEEATQDGPQREGREYVAPITVNNLRLGTIRMASNGTTAGLDDAKVQSIAQKFNLDPKQIKSLMQQVSRTTRSRPAAIQFLFLLANAVARLCYQEYQLRQRINELTAVYNVATMLAETRDLQKMLQRTVELVAQVMGTKAASIRLIDLERNEMVIKAVHNLSVKYLNKGKIFYDKAEIDRTALSGRGYDYVKNMATDPRIQYPQESQEEGIVSMLTIGMRYKGKPIGVLRVYTETETTFAQDKIDLAKAVAAQAAAAIENSRLLSETMAAEALEKQVALAALVQQRMLPKSAPELPGLDMSAIYVPCFELGGDFYDFIPLPYNNVGLTIADVSGKGVPASLIMASVRAAIRAQVDNVFYVYDIMQRINTMICRDTRSSEFVTLFYGVLDTRNKMLTYCNCGHPAALLLRDGQIIELGSENMVLGIDPDEQYKQVQFQLKSHDTLLIYTDGLPDAMNFQQQTFGKQRVIDAFKKDAETAHSVAENILWEVRRFVGLAKPTDDITMMVVKVE